MADTKPNVVLILADDLGWAEIGCLGSTFYETPNLDKLAKRGALFTDAYAASPVCSPTRASILTGKYPSRIGMSYLAGVSGPSGESFKLVPPTVVGNIAPEDRGKGSRRVPGIGPAFSSWTGSCGYLHSFHGFEKSDTDMLGPTHQAGFHFNPDEGAGASSNLLTGNLRSCIAG